MEFSNTIGGFIQECTNYKYSQEAYELDKLASEIDLMSLYSESIQFAYDYAEDIANGSMPLSESFFSDDASEIITEATATMSRVDTVKDENPTTVIDTQKSNKIATFFKRIGTSFMNMLKRIGRFFSRIAAKFIKNDDQRKMITLLNNTTIHKNDVNTIINLGNKYKKDWIFDIIGDQSNVTKVGNIKPKFDTSYDNARNFNMLAAGFINVALSDTIHIYPNANIDIISIDKYVNLITDKTKDNLNKTLDFYSDYYKMLKNTISNSKEKGIILDLSSNTFEDISQSIQNASDAYQDILNQPVGTINKLFHSGDVRTMNEFYQTLITIGGNLMKIIASIATFRTVMYTQIEDILKSYNVFNMKKKTTNTSADDEEIE